MTLRKMIFAAGFALASLSVIAPAAAQSCYDLWYQRNEIFARNGYCFSTSLGKRVFGNAGCYTKNPALSSWEQRRVGDIQAEERRLGCKVNK